MHRWTEEVELLQAEFEWTSGYFSRSVDLWSFRAEGSERANERGPACYARRQQAIYSRLREECQLSLEGVRHANDPERADGGDIA